MAMSASDWNLPDPHLLFSVIKDFRGWATAFCEFADNTFDAAAGNAAALKIILSKDRVVFGDSGRGIPDINVLARLGASPSFGAEGPTLGQYGVGAKRTWMSCAGQLTVDTAHAGLRHRHTFDVTDAIDAFKKKTGNVAWLRKYKGAGVRTQGDSYTTLTLKGIHPWLPPLIAEALVRKLEINYWPAVKGGKTIEILDRRRRPFKRYTVEPLAPPEWTDRETFESAINGRRYTATVGVLTENIGRYKGLHFGYAYRNICVEHRLATRNLPVRVHGQIALSDDWRHTLSPDKTEIVEDRELLLSDIEKLAAEVIEKADSYEEDLRLENIATKITLVVGRRIRNVSGGQGRVAPLNTGGAGGDREKADGQPDKDSTDRTRERPSKPKDPKGNKVTGGVKVRFEPMGSHDLDAVEWNEREKLLTIALNNDCPKIQACSIQPRYPGLFLICGAAHARWVRENLTASDIDRLFGAMLGKSRGDSVAAMAEAIRVWWGFEAEEDERAGEATA